MKYDTDWVRERAKGAYWLDHHACAICCSMVGYHIEGETVLLDTNCDCVSYRTPLRPSSFEDIANWLAMQHHDDTRDKIMSGFKYREPRPDMSVADTAEKLANRMGATFEEKHDADTES